MKSKAIALFLSVLVSSAAAEPPAPHEGVLGEGMVNPGYQDKPDWFKASFLDVREDIDEAAVAGKRVMLYFYQDGCPYCAKLLNDNFGNRAIADKARQAFDVIAINMWGDRGVTDLSGEATTEKAFAAALRVQYTPTLLFMDEQGKVILRINGYFAPHKFDVALDFVAGKHEKQGGFREFYAAASPVAAKTAINKLGGTLSEPLRLDQRGDSGRPLLVLFEQGSCAECDELHRDILPREGVAAALSNLDVAQVNLWSAEKIRTPDGREVPAREWARELGIQYAPSLVFFDRQGSEVFRSEAYLRSFHIHGAVDYVVSGAYRRQPSFQRFLQHRTEVLQERGIRVDLMD
jgi:thioredoxin-related protein